MSQWPFAPSRTPAPHRRGRLPPIDVDAFIDGNRVSAYQVFVVALCAVLMFLDGLDSNIVTFLAPHLAAEWGIGPSQLSLIYTVGLVSAAITSVLNGPIADRYGRRRVMIGYAALFSLFTLLAAWAQSPEQLALFRFVAGIGLGGTLPNALSLGVEYVPARRRTLVAVVLVSALGLGQSAGGVLATALGDHGWRFVFAVGGTAALAMTAIIVLAMPESVRFLAQAPERRAAVARLLRRIRPGWEDDGVTPLASAPGRFGRSRIGALFAEGRAPITVTLLAVAGLNNAQIAFLMFWLPNAMIGSGLPMATAATAVAVMVVSGVAGSFLLGRLTDRFGPYPILLLANGVAVAALALLGARIGDVPTMLVAAAAIGIGVNGFQAIVNSFAAGFYPTAIRATGTGTVFATGRLLSVLGPLVGNLFVAVQLSASAFFIADALVASLAGACLLIGWRHRGGARR
ncbi:MAG: MFS transporter [Sphingomonas sp.]